MTFNSYDRTIALVPMKDNTDPQTLRQLFRLFFLGRFVEDAVWHQGVSVLGMVPA